MVRLSDYQLNATDKRDILSHWGYALPVLIAVAALALRQIDMYPPTYDEFYSMFNSGWIVNSPYSPIEVLQSSSETAQITRPYISCC